MSEAADRIDIDLSETRRAAELVRSSLLDLRAGYDLARYEYTREIRIAPGEIAHSHPTLTLNTLLREPNPILSLYLHEQMHWYATWYSYHSDAGWRAIWAALRQRYPVVPITFPEGAHTESSSYLHLIVNWLEIAATADFLGHQSAADIAAKNFIYSGLYRIVLADWDWLAGLYRTRGLTPIRHATTLSPEDLAIAARIDEATTDSA
jgi:hypothetical protein